MSNLKLRSAINVSKGYLSDAVALLTEVVLGKPVKVQAGCWVSSVPCAGYACGSCGADKRHYQKICDGQIAGCACGWC